MTRTVQLTVQPLQAGERTDQELISQYRSRPVGERDPASAQVPSPERGRALDTILTDYLSRVPGRLVVTESESFFIVSVSSNQAVSAQSLNDMLTGTFAHILIQADFMIRRPGAVAEYPVWGAGFADLVSDIRASCQRRAELWEIKPSNDLTGARAQRDRYINTENDRLQCTKFIPGLGYGGRSIRIVVGGLIVADLIATQPEQGVILYEWQIRPSPIRLPSLLPDLREVRATLVRGAEVVAIGVAGAAVAVPIILLLLPL